MEAIPFSGDKFTGKDNQFIRFTPFDVETTGPSQNNEFQTLEYVYFKHLSSGFFP